MGYYQTFNTKRTKKQNLNVSRFVLQLSLLNPLEPVFKNEDVIGSAPTSDDLSDQQFYCLIRCHLCDKRNHKWASRSVPYGATSLFLNRNIDVGM